MTAVAKNILIVEDQKLIAADIAQTLKRHGYHVSANVATGEEAIAVAKDMHPNLVLMDIRLRGEMDGIQAATIIRERLNLPIIYLTAYADEETVQRVLVTEPLGYLVKPFNERELRAAIEVALYKHSTDRLMTKAQESIRARDEFLAVISHELRTPLCALVLQLSSLETWARKPDLEAVASKLEEKVSRAVHSLDRLTKLIDGLLDVSRMSAGGLNLHLEMVDLSQLVREVVDRMDKEHDTKSKITVDADQSILANCDRVRMEQVIVNLLSNAIKYGEGAGIEVGVSTDADRVYLSVRDHGIGISAEDLPFIFGCFERAPAVRQYRGLGLGLYITAQIVEAHGGKVLVTSTPRAGSTFIASIPRGAYIA